MPSAKRIIIDKDIRFGKPVIKGTRVSVDLILGKLAAGMTYKNISKENDIAREDILAVLRYAQRLVEAFEEAKRMKKKKKVARHSPLELTDEDREWIERGIEEWGKLLDEMDNEDETLPLLKKRRPIR